MRWAARLWDRSEFATVEVARVSQAAVIGIADWSQRHSPAPARRMIRTSLRILDRGDDSPSVVINRPYRLLHNLLSLHGEFAQRLLELAEDDAPPPLPSDAQSASRPVRPENVVDLAGYERARSSRPTSRRGATD